MLHQVHQETMVSGGSVKQNLDAIMPFSPDGRCNLLAAVHLLVDYSVSRAAVAAAIAQAEWHGLVPRIQLFDQLGGEVFPRQQLRACGIREVNRVLCRRGPFDPPASTADPGGGGEVITGTLHIVIPFYLGKSIRHARELCFPAGFIKRIEADWCLSTAFGTGNTITAASTSLRVVFEYLPTEDPKVNPRLVYQRFGLSKFDQEYIPVALGPNPSRLLYLGVVDDAGALAQTMGATDFTFAELRGRTVRTLREPIDNFVRLWNLTGLEEGDAHDGVLPLATSANVEARSIPLVTPRRNSAISQLPIERNPILTLTTGAGAPAVADQVIYAVTVEAPDPDWFAGNWSLMTKGGMRADQVRAAVQQPQGTNGQPVTSKSMARTAPRPVAWQMLRR